MADLTNNETLIASAGNGTRPYGNGNQILVIGVHGTNNGPGNVANVTSAIANGLSATTSGPVYQNASFDWSDRSGTTNSEGDRTVAAGRLTNHVLGIVDNLYAEGKFSRDKPLVIDLAGFSHGGNVAIQSVKDITEGLKERGLNTNAGIHLTTLSTPAYIYDKWGNYNKVEGPGPAAENARIDGVSFAHTHFSVKGDGVIRAAGGNDTYGSAVTRNVVMEGIGIRWRRPDQAAQDGVTNHGLPQDSASHMQQISDTMAARFRGFNPDNRRADASIDASKSTVAMADRPAPIASAKTDVTAKDFGDRGNHFNQALTAANGNPDVAAAIVKSSAVAGHNPKDEINVAVSITNGALIATQGTGPSTVRADGVLASQVQQGTAQNVAEALTQKNPAQQVAAVEQQTERQQQTPRTV
jgi:hypothetical protein